MQFNVMVDLRALAKQWWRFTLAFKGGNADLKCVSDKMVNGLG